MRVIRGGRHPGNASQRAPRNNSGYVHPSEVYVITDEPAPWTSNFANREMYISAPGSSPGLDFLNQSDDIEYFGPPSQASDVFLRGVRERIANGSASMNDWKYSTEAFNRSTPATGMPKYENPGHHDPTGVGLPYNPTKSVLPSNHEELWVNSIVDPNNSNTRWSVEAVGRKRIFHRFQDDGNGTFHWNGSTNGRTLSGEDRKLPESIVPIEIRRN